MGYCIDLMDGSFIIKGKNKAAALRAIQSSCEKLEGKGKHWAWISCQDVLASESLEEFLEYAGWPADKTNSEGRSDCDITGISFSGEKFGSEDDIFEVLAPFVEDGSYLEVSGEDGDLWRWKFVGGHVTSVYCVYDWDGKCAAFDELVKHRDILPTLVGIHPSLDAAIAENLKKKG